MAESLGSSDATCNGPFTFNDELRPALNLQSLQISSRSDISLNPTAAD